MIPTSFEYLAPKTVKEALTLLNKHKHNAKILAGGHSLIPLMKLRLASPKYLIDLAGIRPLANIKESNGVLTIGAMATHDMIQSSPLLRKKCPLLPEVAGEIGDAQVRNKGTIGGSIVHADPAADWPAAILALDAEMKVVGPKGIRTIKAQDFFVDMLTSAVKPNEVLTEIRVPKLSGKTGCAYLKVHQPASGFALVGVAAILTLDKDNNCKQACIGITGVAAMAYRASAVEKQLIGKKLNDRIIEDAAPKAIAGLNIINSDIHASADYRAHLAKVYTKHALQKALSRI